MTDKQNLYTQQVLMHVCCLRRATLDDIDSDEAAGLGRKATIPSNLSADTLSATQCITQLYRKSLRLTSKQIVRVIHTYKYTYIHFHTATQNIFYSAI